MKNTDDKEISYIIKHNETRFSWEKTNCFKFSKLETEIGEKRKMKSEINDWSNSWEICKSRKRKNQHEITIRIK